MSTIATSASLLCRVGQTPNDQAAWGEFVDRYGRLIYNWCSKWGLQKADAEEVTQIVLTKLVERIKTFRYDPAKGAFRGYLRKITHDAWYDFAHSPNHKEAGSGDTGVLNQLQRLEARDELVQRLADEFDLELKDAALQQVKMRVDSQTWEAFQLLNEKGRSQAEVAEQLGIGITKVYQAHHRVKQMAKSILSGWKDRNAPDEGEPA